MNMETQAPKVSVEAVIAPITCICTKDLELHYGTKPAFRNVSLCIPKHRLTAIIGPSGCGKSSFLMCLNRLTDLIPGCKVSGVISLGKQNILDPKTDLIALRRNVGMIFQKPNPFPLSILKNLEFPLKEHGIKHKADRQARIEAALIEVGLWDEVKNRLQSSALALSGGQQQRLCIARALVLRPDVLLMDEPCSALDPISSGVVEELMLKLKTHYTLVVVTHNLGQARRISDQTAFFWMRNEAGYVVESGETEQVFERPHDPLTLAYVSGKRG